jgi:hypothetical protein
MDVIPREGEHIACRRAHDPVNAWLDVGDRFDPCILRLVASLARARTRSRTGGILTMTAMSGREMGELSLVDVPPGSSQYLIHIFKQFE